MWAVEMLSPLIIFVVLLWSGCRRSMFAFPWGLQSWMQCSGGVSPEQRRRGEGVHTFLESAFAAFLRKMNTPPFQVTALPFRAEPGSSLRRLLGCAHHTASVA